MGITSLQVCMDSSDWLQATISEEGTGMDSSPISTPTGEDNSNNSSINLTCSRPLIERRLRPHHEQSLKCPRCESTHTKFCYYNNYSLSQPRYFCKTCRRYWTKGGTLRNIPVGGGCRKNKKPSKKQASGDHHAPSPPPQSAAQPNALIPHPLLCYDGHSSTDLQLAFPEQLQFSGMFNNGGAGGAITNPNFPIEFVENKYEGLILGNQDYMGNAEAGFGGEFGNNFHGFGCSPLGFSNSSFDHGNPSSSSLENCQRLLQPYDHHLHDVKPNATAKMLSIEWNDHQQACNSDPGYNLGSWTGLMNGYGSSAANQLV